MVKYVLLLGVLFTFAHIGQEFSWNENNSLEWSDFKATPDQNSPAAAVTASGITFSHSIKKSSQYGVIGFKTKATAHFYPEHSWCKKNLVNNAILAHEQFHFNITELHVRYLRKNISELAVTQNIALVLKKLHNKANADLQRMQNQYDAETNYSINKEGQIKWMRFIENELHRLDSFKSK